MLSSPIKADLHCHTNASDNSFSIHDVVVQAKNAQLSHLAITDHDTTIGLEEAVQYGKQYDLHIIPGIEISAWDTLRNRRAHILGLYIDPNHPALEELCGATVKMRHEASRQMVTLAEQMGYDINWELVCGYAKNGSAVYKQHIMHALLDRGYCNEINGELYKKLFSRSANEAGRALIPLKYPDAAEAIRAIQLAGGAAVLAHPGQLNNFEAIEEWTDWGLRGVEAFHPSHSLEDTKRALQLADQYGLVVTGGSDYHGLYGDGKFPIGSVTVGKKEMSKLQDCIYHSL